MSGTYYCHECECRRLLTPLSTCAICGCRYIEEIPSVAEEEEDMMTDYEEEFNRDLDFFYIHEGQEDDEEELLEERCLYEQLSSIYNHPIARNFDNDSIHEREERQRIDDLLSSITDGGEEIREEDDIIAYDVRFEQRTTHHNHTTISDESITTSSSRFQLPFARIGRLLETLYDPISDEESEERDDELHSYNRRSFLDNLADILSDYTQEFQSSIETSTQPISNQSLDLILSKLKKGVLPTNDPNVEDECIICQDAFGTTLEIFHLPCNHKFHGECITRWFKIKTSCPVCRQNVGNGNEEEEELEELEILGSTNNTSSSSSHPISIMMHDNLMAGGEQTESISNNRDRLQRLRHGITTRRNNHWLSSSPSNYQLNAPPPTFNQNYENELFDHVFPPLIDDMDWTVNASSMEEVD